MTDSPIMLNIFSNLSDPMYLLSLIVSVPAIIISLSFHESAHAFVAYKLGDPTAKNMGRISMNPLKHLDVWGTLCMIFFRFGWAKPVPINSRYFKNPKRDMAISSFAGPVSNLILAVVGLILYAVTNEVIASLPVETVIKYDTTFYLIFCFVYSFYQLNIYLAIFNLIPIPPLDGSRLAFIFLPDKIYWGVMKYERYIMLAMMVLLYTGILSIPLERLASHLMNGLEFLFGLLPFFPNL